MDCETLLAYKAGFLFTMLSPHLANDDCAALTAFTPALLARLICRGFCLLQRMRARFRLIDTQGLTPDLVRSLYLVILAVSFGQVGFMVTDGPALTGYVRMLGADDFVFSVLMAIPFIGGAMQLFASAIVEKTRARRFTMIFFGTIQRMMWLPVALVPLIFPEQMTNLRVWSVVVFVAVSSCSGAFVNVSFFSLVGDLVPIRIRGRYFSSRSRVMTVVGVIASLFISLTLDALSGYTGYLIVFTLAALFGTADILTFIFIKWPPMPEKTAGDSTLSMARGLIKNKRFLKLVCYWTLWYFSARLPGPFYTVFMLDVLKMSYFQITVLNNIMSMVATAVFVTFWGRLMDSHGYKPVVKLAGLVAAGTPLLWPLLNAHNFYLVGLYQVIAGASWCAVDLSAQNMLLNASPEKNRSFYIAAYSVSTQLIGNALAFVIGGFLIQNVFTAFDGVTIPFVTVNRYTMSFWLSSVLRFIVLFLGAGLLIEPDAKSTRETFRYMIHGLRVRARALNVMIKRKRWIKQHERL